MVRTNTTTRTLPRATVTADKSITTKVETEVMAASSRVRVRTMEVVILTHS